MISVDGEDLLLLTVKGCTGDWDSAGVEQPRFDLEPDSRTEKRCFGRLSVADVLLIFF